jgi:NADH-quinone oxidoreductase subunit M
LPGLCGFIGEVFVVLAAWSYSKVLAVIAASVVILTAGYILWTVQRVYLGPEYKGPHGEALTPATRREVAIVAPLLVFAVLFGVYPPALLNYMTPSVSRTVTKLTDWSKEVREPESRKPSATSTSRTGVPPVGAMSISRTGVSPVGDMSISRTGVPPVGDMNIRGPGVSPVGVSR